MQSNNGWYSVFDTEHKPESGREYLCLGLLDYAYKEADPFADRNNVIYYVATWYDKGDIALEEAPTQETRAENPFGVERIIEKDGFYIQAYRGCKGSTVPEELSGMKAEEYSVYTVWERLGNHGEVMDGLVCWKELDTPEYIN